MKVELSGHVIVLADNSSQRGHQVLESNGFFTPNKGYLVFMEQPQVGAHPWVAYVATNADGSPDYQHATRMPLQKVRITRVER